MFQSSDIYADTFARMLAISGSPIYLTDKPDNINVDTVRKLVLPSGEIPKYDSIAEVLESRLFIDPYAGGNVLVAFARKRDSITLGIFNVAETGQSCSGQILINELNLQGERFIAYSDKEQFETHIVDIDGFVEFSLKNMESDLITLSPVKDGFGLIGVINYFAAPATVEFVEVKDGTCYISLKSPGLLVGYCENEPRRVVCGGKNLTRTESLPAMGCYSWHESILSVCADSTNMEIQTMG